MARQKKATRKSIEQAHRDSLRGEWIGIQKSRVEIENDLEESQRDNRRYLAFRYAGSNAERKTYENNIAVYAAVKGADETIKPVAIHRYYKSVDDLKKAGLNREDYHLVGEIPDAYDGIFGYASPNYRDSVLDMGEDGLQYLTAAQAREKFEAWATSEPKSSEEIYHEQKESMMPHLKQLDDAEELLDAYEDGLDEFRANHDGDDDYDDTGSASPKPGLK